MKTNNQSERKYIQVSAGRGPAECCWVVAQVVKKLIEIAKNEGLTHEVITHISGPERGTVSSSLIAFEGLCVQDTFEPWLGTIQWIGKSTFRKYHKRKNWFIGVSMHDANVAVGMNERDVCYQTFRASGPGGQHRNKVETAVRATHEKSGVTVTSTESKSQHQNKKLALKKLKEAFQQHEVFVMQAQLDNQWKEHLSLERGNPVQVFRGKDFK